MPNAKAGRDEDYGVTAKFTFPKSAAFRTRAMHDSAIPFRNRDDVRKSYIGCLCGAKFRPVAEPTAHAPGCVQVGRQRDYERFRPSNPFKPEVGRDFLRAIPVSVLPGDMKP